MTKDVSIAIELDDGSRIYRPGETLSGRYMIDCDDPHRIKAIEASVLWRTEGKGDEDMAVHDLWRRDAADELQFDLRRPEPFAATLPNTPLSYDGQIIKLLWCVRVRVLLYRGKDVVRDLAFRLGDVAPVGDLSVE